MGKGVITLGITGTMGSGKTTICNMFHRFGAKVIDADKVAHQLMAPFGPVWWTLCEYFGAGIVRRNSAEIDRVKLGSIVFADHFFLRKLNALVHPLIVKEIKYQLEQTEKAGTRIVVLDAPLLIEVGLHGFVDKVVVVLIGQKNRMVRLRKRNPQLTSLQIIQRSCNQMSQESKQKYADFAINNNGNLEKTQRQVYEIFQKVIHEYE